MLILLRRVKYFSKRPSITNNGIILKILLNIEWILIIKFELISPVKENIILSNNKKIKIIARSIKAKTIIKSFNKIFLVKLLFTFIKGKIIDVIIAEINELIRRINLKPILIIEKSLELESST